MTSERRAASHRPSASRRGWSAQPGGLCADGTTTGGGASRDGAIARSAAASRAETGWAAGALIVLAILALITGCKGPFGDGAGKGATLAAAGDQAFSADEVKLASAASTADDDDDGEDGDDEEDVDFWRGVRFDLSNFDEVTDYVSTYYIDEKVDLPRAWVAAANSALGVLDPSYELLPASFVRLRAGHVDEEGRLDGDKKPFVCDGKAIEGVVLHKIPGTLYLKSKAKKMPDRRLTDDEILELRAKAKARYMAYRDAWKPLAFQREQFLCVMGWVKAELAKQKPAHDARAAAAAAAKKARERAAAKASSDAARPSAATAGAAAGQGAKADRARDSAKTDRAHQADRAGRADRADKNGSSAKAGGANATAKAGSTAGKGDAKGPPPGLYDPDPDAEKHRRWEPDIHRAWLAAASAYLYALDPHSAVIARKQWDDSTRKTQDSSFEGIGAVLTQREKRTIVENPMEDLPAWRAGVRAGDEIQKVDGVNIEGWMLHKVVEKIRGKKMTTVTLTVLREGEPRPLEIPIVRARIPIKNVTGKLLAEYPGVAHIKMTGFVPRSARDLRDAIDDLGKKAPGGKLEGLILDLRRNSGGLLNRAIDIADMFLKSGTIVTVRSRRKAPGRDNEEVYTARKDPSDYEFPVVVLVDDGSASASEIVASALQENGRALVVGQRTFGKASVQTLFEPALNLDYYIKLTVARYYGPTGNTLQVTGVHPDVEIAPKADGKIPVGFREENLTNHLEPISAPAPSPMAPMVKSLDACVERTGLAKKIATRQPRPQIQPDYQMLRAADYLRCLARLDAGK